MNSIVICTNNLVPQFLFREVLKNAFIQADMVGDTIVSVVSHYPVFEKYIDFREDSNQMLTGLCFKKEEHKQFSEILLKKPVFNPEFFGSRYFNLVVGECEYSHRTIYSQLILGARYNECSNIIIMEHDVLYPLCYLRTVSKVLDAGIKACYWANGKFFSNYGFFDIPDVMTLSRFSLEYLNFIRVFSNKLEKNLCFVEPVLKGLPIFGDLSEEISIRNFAMIHGIETVDIRHGLNVSGSYVVSKYADSHEYWGSASMIYPLLDGGCKEYVEKHPTCNYGIWS